MKLLQSEIEITPGRPGNRPSVVSESQPVPGSAILRVINTMPQENAFVVRLRCEHPLWQDAWYTITSLPPPPGAVRDAQPGKPDQRGPQDRSIKIYVPRGGSRDLLVRFDVPQQPEARAGRYPFLLEVENQVVGPADNGRRRNRVTTVSGAATIRPYYRWSMDITPEDQRVGLRRRTADFEVVITNEGNDWLYCDLQLPRPRDMVLDCPTLRLAVPPPEPGETITINEGRDSLPGTQRAVPLRAVTHLKTVKGDVTPQPLLLSALRLDAPSVPPPATDSHYNGVGAVVAVQTTESQQVAGERSLIYCPPIPSKLTDLFRQSATTIRTFVMSVVGLALILPTAYVAFEQSRHSVSIKPMGFAYAGRPLVLGDKWVLGTRVTFTGKIGDRPIPPVTVNTQPVPGKMTDPDRAQVAIPASLNHMTGTMTAQRFARFIPWPFSQLMPKSTCPITVGDALPPPTVYPVSQQLVAGQTVTISGASLGEQTGSVRIGDKEAQVKKWTSSSITVVVPTLAPSARCPVVVTPSGGTALTPSGGELPAITTPQALHQGQEAARQVYADKVGSAKAALDASSQETANFELEVQTEANAVDRTNPQAVADFNSGYMATAKLKAKILEETLNDRKTAYNKAVAALKKYDAGGGR